MASSVNEEYREFVPNVTFELIPIRQLVSNQDYQRNLSRRHVERTADSFDVYQINPVKVSRRGNVNYVFNGQHTIETVARVSGSRDTPVWCMVYQDLEYTEEADIFANQMKFTKVLSPYEVFVANIEAGNEDQLTIKKIVESFDLKIGTCSSQRGTVCAVAALEHIYSRYGYHVLEHTLFLAVATWEGEPISLSAGILKGIAKLLSCYEDKLQDECFVERLSRVSPKEIIRNAKERSNGVLGYAEALLVCYNKRVKVPLSQEYLYSGRRSHSFLNGEEETHLDSVQSFGSGDESETVSDDLSEDAEEYDE